MGVKFTLDKLNVRGEKWLLFSEYLSGSADQQCWNIGRVKEVVSYPFPMSCQEHTWAFLNNLKFTE